MMIRHYALAVLLLLVGAGLARADSYDDLHIRTLFDNATCASPPCDSPVVRLPGGAKTVSIEIDGTATVETRCKYVTASNTKEDVFSTTTGTNPAVDGFLFTEMCGAFKARITACTGCTVRSYVFSENGF